MKQYELKLTNKFKKQLKQLQKQPNFDYDALNDVLNRLTANDTLPFKYRNHLLKPKSKRYLGVSCTTRFAFGVSENW